MIGIPQLLVLKEEEAVHCVYFFTLHHAEDKGWGNIVCQKQNFNKDTFIKMLTGVLRETYFIYGLIKYSS